MLTSEEIIDLSKIISHALRHNPTLYNITLDKDGFTDIDNFIKALKDMDLKWKSLSIKDVELMINLSEKKRHEIVGEKIRAFYGHSTSAKIVKNKSEPPAILFHCTTADKVESIFALGLMSMKRQYVHLSENIEDAIKVGARRNKRIQLLVILASEAYSSGVNFYKEQNAIWLSDDLPPIFIKNS